MKRLVLGVLSALLVTMLPVAAHAVDLQNFTITEYNIDYRLSRDAGKRSVLTTTETITAQFPSNDQNHGIERSIPQHYDGHSVHLDIVSVKKPDGSNWTHETRSDEGDNRVVRIGDANTYLHGKQTFVITYTQRDVTKTFSDTGDEFYWDTNGLDWRVGIARLTVTLKVDDELSSRLNGAASCYRGVEGSTTSCQLTKSENTYRLDEARLNARENVTIAVGFKDATFGAYEPSLWDKVVAVYMKVLLVTSIIGAALSVWLLVRANRRSERRQERGTIIAEYVPPKDTSLTTSASLLSARSSVFSAQLLDLAVRGYLTVYQTREKSFWKSAEYDIEIRADISGLKAEEREILSDIFGGQTAVGSRLAMKSLRNNSGVYARTLDNDKKLDELVRGEYGLRHKAEAERKWFTTTGFILLGSSVLLLSPGLLVAASISFLSSVMLWPLTDKGLALSRYLEGLKEYIKVAEADRIRMLQSPEGAQKIGDVDVSDGRQLVTLYEKVLPYAVLFGQEKEWTKRLGDIYESVGTSPAWYGSNGTFNAAVFSSAMSGFTTAGSYASNSSSSTGGSSGSGSSGGGGGGGGGGGW